MTYVAQEGGDHYQAEYQHWDWVIDAGLGYLEGCATKYVSRWWKKNGLQDLLKAKTYVQKMISNYDAVYALALMPPDNIDELNARFKKANNLPDLEYQFCCLMSDWQSTQQLQFALDLLDKLIQSATEAARRAQGQGGTLPPASPGKGTSAAPYGAGGGAVAQAPATSSPTDVHRKGLDGMEHPFGYDNWHENGFHSVNRTKTEDGYNG